jgi:hypothetical protein
MTLAVHDGRVVSRCVGIAMQSQHLTKADRDAAPIPWLRMLIGFGVPKAQQKRGLEENNLVPLTTIIV